MANPVTPELVTAYWFCQRKAFLLLRGDKGDVTHDYVTVTALEATRSFESYFESCERSGLAVVRGDKVSLDGGKHDVIMAATLKVDGFEAKADFLIRPHQQVSPIPGYYEPYLATGTHSVSEDQKIQLAVTGHILAKVLGIPVLTGGIVNAANKTTQIKLAPLSRVIEPIIENLKGWTRHLPEHPPSIFVKDHCGVCLFRQSCLQQAEIEDNLSLLDRMTPKIVNKYNKNGVFTIKQLSYLYRPRRKHKKAGYHSLRFDFALQALAIRNQKTYVHELPSIGTQTAQLFLDLEGIPDQGFVYLVGLIVCTDEKTERYSFWADSSADEKAIFDSFQQVVEKHPKAPIYHYGSYESKYIARIAKRYDLNCDDTVRRLVNLNTYIFGKIYFPLRSNSLKEIGRFLGAKWSDENASGLQSVIWRLRWDERHQDDVKQKLIRYNMEDCEALRRLLSELRNIALTVTDRADVDFADTPKQHLTLTGQSIHSSFKEILRSAHAEYNENRIGINQHDTAQPKGPTGGIKGHPGAKRIIPKPTKTVRVRRPIRCPKHKGWALEPSDRVYTHTVIDLKKTTSGFRKVITKVFGNGGYCNRCCRTYFPPGMRRFYSRHTGQRSLFGHNIQAWVIYTRIVLRLPLAAISQSCEELFDEPITDASIGNFILRFAEYYAPTENILLARLLASPFIHADETKINVQGVDHYIWVLTNGTHVIFRITETRTTAMIQELLKGYKGTLISDFYGAYDAVDCRHQKCLVHLIRDLNEDLWKNPFNGELEQFIAAFRKVLIPIMADVRKYGLRKRNLQKHRRVVDRYYNFAVDGCISEDEIVQRYQKRFIRYRNFAGGVPARIS